MMRQYISKLILWTVGAVAAIALAVVIVPQSASALDFFGGACSGAGSASAACSGNGNDNISGKNGIILRATELVSIIAGIAAIIVIMIAGIMFVTAGGDSNRISTAKNTIIYSVVGLVVIVLARTIVIFVVTRV
jgi:hypothetical protein